MDKKFSKKKKNKAKSSLVKEKHKEMGLFKNDYINSLAIKRSEQFADDINYKRRTHFYRGKTIEDYHIYFDDLYCKI